MLEANDFHLCINNKEVFFLFYVHKNEAEKSNNKREIVCIARHVWYAFGVLNNSFSSSCTRLHTYMMESKPQHRGIHGKICDLRRFEV